MKKFVIISMVLLLAILLSGCVQPTEAIVETSVETDVVTDTVVVSTTELVPTTVVNTVTVVKVIDPISGNEYTIKQGEWGVANAEADVNSYFNGLNASWIGLVLNGDDTEHQLNVTVTPYNNADLGINNSPEEVADWVTITNPNLLDGVLTVSPMSAASLYTTLNVPSGIQLPQDWGFLVNVSDANSGNYKTVDTIRWLVHMRS